MSNFLIPDRALYLARQVQRCIMPFLKLQPRVGSVLEDCTDIWGKSSRSLEEIFKLALQVKVRLLFSTDLFMVIYHSAGELFSETSMAHEHGVNQTSQPPHIKLTVAPGLRRYAAADGAFSYNRFVREEPRGGLIPERLAPAIVSF